MSVHVAPCMVYSKLAHSCTTTEYKDILKHNIYKRFLGEVGVQGCYMKSEWPKKAWCFWQNANSKSWRTLFSLISIGQQCRARIEQQCEPTVWSVAGVKDIPKAISTPGPHHRGCFMTTSYFLYWCMWFNRSPTKVWRQFLTNAFCYRLALFSILKRSKSEHGVIVLIFTWTSG